MRFGRELVFEIVNVLEIDALTSPVIAFIKVIDCGENVITATREPS